MSSAGSTTARALCALLMMCLACRAHGTTGSPGRVQRAQAERIAIDSAGGLGVLTTMAESEGQSWMVDIQLDEAGARAEVEVDSTSGRVLSLARRRPPDADDPTAWSARNAEPTGQ